MNITKKKETKLEKEINDAIEVLSMLKKWTPEYTKVSSNIETLMKAQSYDCKRQSISWDTLLGVGGNLAGILIILNYEKLNVLTSKAVGFVIRGRV